jgi:hypothetical protein
MKKLAQILQVNFFNYVRSLANKSRLKNKILNVIRFYFTIRQIFIVSNIPSSVNSNPEFFVFINLRVNQRL